MEAHIQKNKPALGKGLASLLPGAGSGRARSVLGELANLPPAEATARGPFNNPATDMPAAIAEENRAASASAPKTATSGAERIPGITLADVEQIVPNQYQPRRDFNEAALKDLCESIKANGVIQPLVVRRGADGRLHLIAGERRLRASKMAGLKQVPVVVRKSTDKEALEIALVENVQRQDLNCVDVALSYFQLMEDFHLTQEEVAARVGKERSSVANHLRLLKLPEPIIDDLRKEKLSYGHGKALLAVADPLKRMDIRNKIVEKGLSVRETEKQVAELLTGTAPKRGRKKKGLTEEEEGQLVSVSERVGRALGARVSFKGDLHRGALVVEYFSKDDLDRLVEQLLG